MINQRQKARQNERAWLIIIALVAILMYYHTLIYLWSKWMDDAQNSLGFLVPLVCGYFFWRKYPEIKNTKRQPSNWGLVIIVFSLIMHAAGMILDVSGPSALSIVTIIVGGCLYFHGSGLVRLMSFPLAYMLFMIPVPGGVMDKITMPMQEFASKSTVFLLSLIIPNVQRQGIQIRVDGFLFEVAPACSGMSSLVALVGVCAVFAYLTQLTNRFKWLLFSFSVPIAIAVNIIRICSIGMLGYYWDWEQAMSIYHEWSSPMLFVVAILILFLINWGLELICERRATR